MAPWDGEMARRCMYTNYTRLDGDWMARRVQEIRGGGCVEHHQRWEEPQLTTISTCDRYRSTPMDALGGLATALADFVFSSTRDLASPSPVTTTLRAESPGCPPDSECARSGSVLHPLASQRGVPRDGRSLVPVVCESPPASFSEASDG
jgi:hypothetical protein